MRDVGRAPLAPWVDERGRRRSSHGEKDVDQLTRLAEAGDVQAMFSLGKALYKDKPQEAKQWWTEATKHGHKPSMKYLGRAFSDEEPHKRSRRKSTRRSHAREKTSSSEQKDLESMHALGDAWRRAANGPEALRRYRQAAEQGA